MPKNIKKSIIIDLATLNRVNAEGCPACNRKFVMGDMAVMACGSWQGGPKLVHENEAVFDPDAAMFVERQCYLSGRKIGR